MRAKRTNNVLGFYENSFVFRDPLKGSQGPLGVPRLHFENNCSRATLEHVPPGHMFKNSFISQIDVEHLPCARHCSRRCECLNGQNRQNPCQHRVYIVIGRMFIAALFITTKNWKPKSP